MAGVRYRTEPGFEFLHRELKQHRHLTLQLLWEVCRVQEPGGYGYSRFCNLYRRWRRKQNLVMRQEHRAGEKVAQRVVVRYHLAGTPPAAPAAAVPADVPPSLRLPDSVATH